MDLDKTKVINNDSWNDIEALEAETRALLETVKGKSKAKRVGDSNGKQQQQQGKKQVKTPKAGATSKDKNAQSLTLNLYATPKATLEVLDDAPPDSTPRDIDTDEAKRLAQEKLKRAQMLKLEQSYRSLSFMDEARRVKEKKDVFTANSTISLDDIQYEKERLQRIEEVAKQRQQFISGENRSRSEDLKADRAALQIQSIFRGHLGRRRMSLIRYINQATLQQQQQNETASDWVQVHDKETGDSWYYNKVTNKSQWEKPEVLKQPLPEISKGKGKPSHASAQLSNTQGTAGADKTRTLSVSMSLPTLKSPTKKPNTRKVLAQSQVERSESMREMAIQREINAELKIHKLEQKDALLAPDGTFKPQLRSVVVDALLDTRFDNVSTVLADTRWFDQNQEPFVELDQQDKAKLRRGQNVEARLDLNKAPMVAVMNLHAKKEAKRMGMIRLDGTSGRNDADGDRLLLSSGGGDEPSKPSDLTLKDIAHPGFDSTQQGPMCFGCWSAGFHRKCAVHEDGSKPKPSQTMLLCRNWDLDVMRRRYRSEEIQEIFLQQESSLRFDVKHKKFYTVVEQRHPIYRLVSQQLERLNARMTLFCRIKYWMLSMAEVFRQGHVDADREDRARFYRIRRGILHLSRIERFTSRSRSLLPLPPITGYSWAERQGMVQHLFKHLDSASGQEVDIIVAEPTPIPVQLYQPREYHVTLPKTFPLPRPGASVALSSDPLATLPANSFIDDLQPSAWIERIAAVTAREGIDAGLAQVQALTPTTPLALQTRSKRPAPCTMKFATIGLKPTPNHMAVGGLPVELLVYQIISTYFPPQYGSFMVMDKGSVSPGVSPEVTITFQSLLMPPTLEAYVERALEHALNYRRVPTITANSNVLPEDKHYYGLNRPEQTGEQDPHGFRTTTWAPQLQTQAETDPQVFVPGQVVASLNTPKANVSYTTHADSTYPFCEPSTRDNSTLDFYHLLLYSVVSHSLAQVFTALTVQEPGHFQKAYQLDLAMGHLVVSVYRSWAYRQQDTIQEFKTDDGVSYWYHRKTGQTFWERPRSEMEEKSPLEGGVLLDRCHDEEPMMLCKGEEGAERRYLQGEMRELVLKHIETKKEALNRRKAAAVTVRNARERGVVPPLLELASMEHLPSTGGMPSMDNLNVQLEVIPQSTFLPTTDPSASMMVSMAQDRPLTAGAGSLFEPSQLVDPLGSTHNLMNYYAPTTAAHPAGGGGGAGPSHVVRGSNLDEPSAYPGPSVDMMHPPMGGHVQGGGSMAQGLMPSHMHPSAPSGGMGMGMPSMGGYGRPHPGVGMATPPVLGGMDGALLNNLTQTIGAMFSQMMNLDRSNPQDMIQLGLGMGMALMQTGAVNQLATGQIQQVEGFTAAASQGHGPHGSTSDEARGDEAQALVVMPSLVEETPSVFSQSQGLPTPMPTGAAGGGGGDLFGPPESSALSIVSTSSQPMAAPHSHAHFHREPIGKVHPTTVLSSDRALDHREEQNQRHQNEHLLSVPLTTKEKARNLVVEGLAPTVTPDQQILKAPAAAIPANAEQALFDEQAVPLVAYPELSTLPALGSAPPSYVRKLPAGLGSRFVSKEEEESQKMVPGTNLALRRTVMPLPVGFFDAIEAKHVATQAVDYLPQVPNFPQSRTIGRVKPRSAAADWLMISFDPWSAGRNPLSSEFVPSLMTRADRLLRETEGRAVDAMENLHSQVLGTAFVNVKDEAGIAQQRAEISKAQILSEDFKKLCSLCRHGKFADAEQLINQPDWAVPVDYQDDQGNALLHIAAQNGSRRLVKLCLRRGASLNLQNLTGQTALHFAFGYGYDEVGNYLVSKGADDSIRNKDGLTCYEGLGARELALL